MMQSSESNKYLSQIPQILYLLLENALVLRRKIIYLNGNNSYFINNLLFLIEDVETEEDIIGLEYLKTNKLQEFKNIHNIPFTKENRKLLLYPDLHDNPIFKGYHNGTNNLIYQYKFGNFMLKYTDGDKLTNKIFNCDSLHKLRY